MIQPTTFGEFSGKITERVRVLAKIFRQSGIPYQIVPDMHHWQVSHLGMVVPLADAYYKAMNPKNIYQEKRIMKDTAIQMKKNFYDLSHRHMLAPFKFHLIRLLPVPILTCILQFVYQSRFGEVFMYQHAMKAPDEMRELHDTFYNYMNCKKA